MDSKGGELFRPNAEFFWIPYLRSAKRGARPCAGSCSTSASGRLAVGRRGFATRLHDRDTCPRGAHHMPRLIECPRLPEDLEPKPPRMFERFPTAGVGTA